jgi:hypothetical protein
MVETELKGLWHDPLATSYHPKGAQDVTILFTGSTLVALQNDSG